MATWLVVELSHHEPTPPHRPAGSASAAKSPAPTQGLGPVPVGSLSPVRAQVQADCRKLIDALPTDLGRLHGRAVAASPHRAAAWGHPPIVLRCGVVPPTGPTTQLLTLDGVDWTAVPRKTDVTWTTVGRRVTVQVLVPKSYAGQGPLLSQLSPAIIRTVPKTGSHNG